MNYNRRSFIQTAATDSAAVAISPQLGVSTEKYKQDWRKLPREIPDSFVREFGEWYLDNGVKGKIQRYPLPSLHRLGTNLFLVRYKWQ